LNPGTRRFPLSANNSGEGGGRAFPSLKDEVIRFDDTRVMPIKQAKANDQDNAVVLEFDPLSL
jgi:hypothetical protein